MSEFYIQHPTYSRAELMVSELAYAVFNGEKEVLQAAIKEGINWPEEPDIFTAALWGQKIDLARELLKAGFPITDKLYSEIYLYGDHQLLNDLPHRPDILKKFKKSEMWHQFLYALTDQDEEQVSSLLPSTKRRINDKTDFLADRIQRTALHLAARNANAVIIKLLIENGAHVNELDGQGKSAMRIVAECSSASKSERRESLRILKSAGGKFTPEISGWLTRWQIERGHWLS